MTKRGKSDKLDADETHIYFIGKKKRRKGLFRQPRKAP